MIAAGMLAGCENITSSNRTATPFTGCISEDWPPEESLELNVAPEEQITIGETKSDDISSGKIGIGNASGAHTAVNIRIEQGDAGNKVFEKRYHLDDEEGIWFKVVERNIYRIQIENLLCDQERAETIKPAEFGCFRVEGGDPSCLDSNGEYIIKINDRGEFYRPTDLSA